MQWQCNADLSPPAQQLQINAVTRGNAHVPIKKPICGCCAEMPNWQEHRTPASEIANKGLILDSIVHCNHHLWRVGLVRRRRNERNTPSVFATNKILRHFVWWKNNRRKNSFGTKLYCECTRKEAAVNDGVWTRWQLATVGPNESRIGALTQITADQMKASQMYSVSVRWTVSAEAPPSPQPLMPRKTSLLLSLDGKYSMQR